MISRIEIEMGAVPMRFLISTSQPKGAGPVQFVLQPKPPPSGMTLTGEEAGFLGQAFAAITSGNNS